MSREARPPVPHSSASDIARFLDAAGRISLTPQGRLLFALDATGSRQPTWDRAAHLQGEMFQAAASVGDLAMQLCFYRGFGEFRASPWLRDSAALVRMMTTVQCRAGQTQIRKVLKHALNVAQKQRLSALVFVGDCIEESIDELGAPAGQLGVRGVPAFMFHEGSDPSVGYAFCQIARLSGGAYCRFDHDSADQLRDLLCAVAVYAAGGRAALQALADRTRGAAAMISGQLPAPG